MPGSMRMLLVSAALVLTACGGGGGSDLSGAYENDVEGTLVVHDDGTASLQQSGDPVPLTYEVTGDHVTFDADPNDDSPENAVVATIRDDSLVFEPGAFSGDEETVFTKQ